jgi:hypothetical protein
MRVDVLILQLIHQKLQADGILDVEPATCLYRHLLGIDVANNRAQAIELESQILAAQVLPIVTNRMSKDDYRSVVTLKSWYLGDGLYQKLSKILPSVTEGDEADFSETVACWPPRTAVRGGQMGLLTKTKEVVPHFSE